MAGDLRYLMAIKQITNTVAYTDPQGNAIANGTLTLDLSQAAKITAGGEIGPTRVVVSLDASGNIPASTNLWANDQLTPTTTTYRIKLYNSNGMLVTDFGQQTIAGTSPIDLAVLTPVTPP